LLRLRSHFYYFHNMMLFTDKVGLEKIGAKNWSGRYMFKIGGGRSGCEKWAEKPSSTKGSNLFTYKFPQLDEKKHTKS